MSDLVNTVFAGIGGQGIILASDMLTRMAFRSGHDVKKSELHGMSQRGGSVSSDVRYGEKVFSPMVPRGEADFLVVLSEDQVPVCKDMLKPGGVLLTPAILGDFDPGRSLNIAMLGALNAHIGLPVEHWHELIRSVFKGELADVNIDAFSKGMECGKKGE